MPGLDLKQTLDAALQEFESIVSTSDASDFRTTQIDDVRQAALRLERDQEHRKCLRNLRRIEPLLHKLERLKNNLDAISKGSPTLCYIWVPLSSEYMEKDTYMFRPLSNSSCT